MIWMPHEIFYLKTNYGILSAFEIADNLDKSVHSIYGKARQEGISSSRWEKIHSYNHLSDSQKGWIAGILDGEGWIGTDKRSKRITIQVNNTDTKMLNQLHSLCGGNRYKGKAAHGNYRQQHIWVLSRRNNVVTLLNSVFPYLITKRDTALRALQHVSC